MEVYGVNIVHTVVLCEIIKNNTKINVLKQIEKRNILFWFTVQELSIRSNMLYLSEHLMRQHTTAGGYNRANLSVSRESESRGEKESRVPQPPLIYVP